VKTDGAIRTTPKQAARVEKRASTVPSADSAQKAVQVQIVKDVKGKR
jgi:hypothetical protein